MRQHTQPSWPVQAAVIGLVLLSSRASAWHFVNSAGYVGKMLLPAGSCAGHSRSSVGGLSLRPRQALFTLRARGVLGMTAAGDKVRFV